MFISHITLCGTAWNTYIEPHTASMMSITQHLLFNKKKKKQVMVDYENDINNYFFKRILRTLDSRILIGVVFFK